MNPSYFCYGARCCAPASALWSDFCAVAPHPDLCDKLKADLAKARTEVAGPLGAAMGLSRDPRPLGFDDGVTIPPEQMPFGTPMRAIRSTAADRAPLRGTLRAIVVPHGSAKEYYRDAKSSFDNLPPCNS
jgi:immune inhibitor A